LPDTSTCVPIDRSQCLYGVLPSFGPPLVFTQTLASPSSQPRADSLELYTFPSSIYGKMSVFDKTKPADRLVFAELRNAPAAVSGGEFSTPVPLFHLIGAIDSELNGILDSAEAGGSFRVQMLNETVRNAWDCKLLIACRVTCRYGSKGACVQSM